MKYALLIIESVGIGDKPALDVRNLADTTPALLESFPQIEQINQGAYLIQLESGQEPLLKLYALAAARELKHRTLFFPELPAWIKS